MCKSKCSGSCISLLKNKLIDSKQSLTELDNLLSNLTECGVSANTDTNYYMMEVNNLKTEARRLLDEVNNQAASANGKINSIDYIENIFEELSFKERLIELKQKIHGLFPQKN